MKKIVCVLIALLAVCLTLSAVSADEGWSFSFGSNTDGGELEYSDGNLTIQGFNYTIPTGYEEQVDMQSIGVEDNESEGYYYTTDVFTKGDDQIIITVTYSDENITADDFTFTGNPDNTTISGIAGYSEEKDDGSYAFTYFEDGYMIGITAPDEATVEKLLAE